MNTQMPRTQADLNAEKAAAEAAVEGKWAEHVILGADKSAAAIPGDAILEQVEQKARDDAKFMEDRAIGNVALHALVDADEKFDQVMSDWEASGKRIRPTDPISTPVESAVDPRYVLNNPEPAPEATAPVEPQENPGQTA